MSKLVVILGPTSSGKSSLAINLAKKFNGEVISADSRQVYKGMDIGTGKVSKSEQKQVPHHLLDIASPKKQYTVTQFKTAAQKKIKQISQRGRLPFVVGGTAFYIYALIDDLKIPEVKPNLKLRKSLQKKSPVQLFLMLKKLDPARAESIDRHNPARLIRAIEIVRVTKKPVPALSFPVVGNHGTGILIIGIKKDLPGLYKLIDNRLEKRLKQGLVKEVKRLLANGISQKKLESFGLEYKFVSKYIKSELNYSQMKEQLKNAIHHYAKRQMTWFKRDPRIQWIKNAREAEILIKKLPNKKGAVGAPN
jgi:tRNA dimethylallyltransferase